MGDFENQTEPNSEMIQKNLQHSNLRSESKETLQSPTQASEQTPHRHHQSNTSSNLGLTIDQSAIATHRDPNRTPPLQNMTVHGAWEASSPLEAGAQPEKFLGQSEQYSTYSQYPEHPDQVPSGVTFCEGCGKVIQDKFILQTTDKQCWHEECLRCVACGCKLDHTCFIKNAQPYCKTDYEALCSGKCNGCGERIPGNELVMRVAGGLTYHLGCFSCTACHTLLQTGDQFVLAHNQLLCRIDFEKQYPDYFHDDKSPSKLSSDGQETLPVKPEPTNEETEPLKLECDDNEIDQSHASDNELDSPKDESDYENELENSKEKSSSLQQKPCRKRVILTTQQRRAFKAAFDMSSKPCRKVREQLARDTGLSVRVVQVWFQNERAKVKKLAKRQQQQHQSHLEQSMTSPHMISEDGQYGIFLPNEAFMHPAAAAAQLDGRFPQPAPNHLLHGTEPNVFHTVANSVATSEIYLCGSGAAPGSGAQGHGDSDFAGSDFPQMIDIKESELYPSMKMSNSILHPIDKLYSMQTSYFTPS